MRMLIIVKCCINFLFSAIYTLIINPRPTHFITLIKITDYKHLHIYLIVLCILKCIFEEKKRFQRADQIVSSSRLDIKRRAWYRCTSIQLGKKGTCSVKRSFSKYEFFLGQRFAKCIHVFYQYFALLFISDIKHVN